MTEELDEDLDLVHPDSWFVGRFNCCHTFVFMMKNALPTTLVSLAWAMVCAWMQVPGESFLTVVP